MLFFIPGYLGISAFFKENELDLDEKIAISIGASITTITSSIILINLILKIPITSNLVIISVFSICFIFLIIGILNRNLKL